MRVEERLTKRDHVLVAFDGPIAELPPAGGAADRLRLLVADAPLPKKVARTADPFVVLAHAATIGPATERALYKHLCRIEHELVATAKLTPGVEKAMAVLVGAGTWVTVVSSLATGAVRAFLAMNGLSEHVRHIIARTGPDRAVLPPAPDLITAAIHQRAIPVELCLFVGSTAADRTAARTAGVRTIRHRRRAIDPAAEPPPNPWFDALSTLAVS